jgi:glycine cleavage system aminomethyltransferase T
VSLGFLTCGSATAAAPAESPMSGATERAGARFEVRSGWRVPVRFVAPEVEAAAVREAVGWADASHLRKTEVQGPPEAIGSFAEAALEVDRSLWCALTPACALVLEGPGVEVEPPLRALDVTAQFAAVRVAGPAARETIARFCALDLRASVTPVGAFRPGSVARTPGFVLCEGPGRYLHLVGAARGEYLWSVVADAGTARGGRPVGVDAVLEGSANRA